MIKLSTESLSEPQLNILGKGLKFCPTQASVDMAEVRKDLDTFHNRLSTIGQMVWGRNSWITKRNLENPSKRANKVYNNPQDRGEG